MIKTNADLMIETQLSLVTQHTHANLTDGVESITREILEYCALDFDDYSDTEFLDLEGEELLYGYLKTLNHVTNCYDVKFDYLKNDYEKVIEEFAQNPKISSIAGVLLQRDLRIMEIVIIELEALRDTLLAKESAGYDNATIETYVNNEVEDTMKLIDERVRDITSEVNFFLKGIKN